jgi:hypothetical protein
MRTSSTCRHPSTLRTRSCISVGERDQLLFRQGLEPYCQVLKCTRAEDTRRDRA